MQKEQKREGKERKKETKERKKDFELRTHQHNETIRFLETNSIWIAIAIAILILTTKACEGLY